MIRFRLTRGHMADARSTTTGETAIAITGHCEERYQDTVDVVPIGPFSIVRRPPGSLHRIAGPLRGGPVLELVVSK